MLRRTRTCIVASLVGLGVSWFALALSLAGVTSYPTATLTGDTQSIPAAVLARSDVARANMKTIWNALYAYAAENSDDLPTDLMMLYPAYISDPRVFWHPGDSDPQPTTINNGTPNQPNSLRISFEYTTAKSMSELSDTDPVIWDNSVANNAGYFVNTLTWSGFKTTPPFATPTPTRREVALHNLRSLALGLYTYATENNEYFPTDLLLIADWYSPSTFWNPGDNDPEPTTITNSVPNATNSTQISYAYLGGRGGTTERKVVLVDNSLANNDGAGVHVITSDGSTLFCEPSTRYLPSAVTARAHLMQLGMAVLTYTYDNRGHFPPKLSALYPTYVADPAVFWNPGDYNTCPTTINNDTPDATNSAQVSFRYLGADFPTNPDPQAVLVLDDSLSNNGGTGANILFADGHVGYYAPASPSCQHPPACMTIAKANLNRIGAALNLYSWENEGTLPATLSMLYPYWVSDPAAFWNPGDANSSPLTISNDVANQDNSGQISFEYVAVGGNLDNMSPRDVLVRDNSVANNAGRGINVLYADGHVGFTASVTLSSITITSGPSAVPAGGYGNYTCTATYSDNSTWDVTNYATWSVTSGPGGVSNQGTFAAPLTLASGASATLHVSYTENGVTRTADKIIAVQICHDPFADADGDGDVDQDDFGVFQRCYGTSSPLSALCSCFDRPEPPSYPNGNGSVDSNDLAKFINCLSGPGIPASPGCDDQ